jgi:phage terminase large subunit-like protein
VRAEEESAAPAPNISREPCPYDADAIERMCREGIPGYDPWRDATDDLRFDRDKALAACRFFWDRLSHHQGRLALQCFALLPWEVAIIGNLFGWFRADGTRRYREAYISVARKNGKTTLGAGMVVYSFFADAEPGAQCYSCAAEREQAAMAFNVARTMIAREPSLNAGVKMYQRAVVLKDDPLSSYRPISAQAHSKHGYNPHFVLSDELHAQKSRELIDVLKTGMGARRQPLIVHITTAGWDRSSICWEIYGYAKRVMECPGLDPYFLPVIYEVGEDDNWEDESNWIKANPCLDVTISTDFLRAEYQKAKELPAYENTFRNLYLNQWVGQSKRWLPMDAWDECSTEPDMESLKGRECFAGLDLAATTDTTALVVVFPSDDGYFDILPFFWLPAENMRARERRDRAPYELWVRQGYLETVPGNVMEYGPVAERILQIARQYKLASLGFDPVYANALIQDLQARGIRQEVFVAMRQGWVTLSAPSAELQRLVQSRKLRHGGHPLLRHQANNIAAEVDSAGNIKLHKGRSTGRVDGIFALIMALGRVGGQSAQESAYHSRGITFI